jgi:hypothetical protein
VSAAVPSATYVSRALVARRLPTWLLLACTSVWLAEVTATSSRFPFVTVEGWVMLVPLYGLHALLGGWLVMRAERVTWPIVYLPGVLFGLYEAYITKVLWDPTWSKADWHWQAGGLYLAQTAILVLFWHPVFAFILPLTLVERAATGSSEILAVLPRPLRWLAGSRWGLVVLGLLAGTYSSIGASWLRRAGVGGDVGRGGAAPARGGRTGRAGAVAPGRPAVEPPSRGLAGLLVLGYLVLGVGMRRGSVPPIWPGQVTVWVMYAVVDRAVRAGCTPRSYAPVRACTRARAGRTRALVILGVAFTAAALVGSLFGGVGPVVGSRCWSWGRSTGAVWFVGVVVRTLARPAS